MAVRLERPTRKLYLHAVDLDLGLVRAVRDGLAVEPTVTPHREAEAVELRFAEELEAGDWALGVAWTGPIRDDLRGLYRSTRGAERYAATQFEAADARRGYPCFDEPEFKARFALTLVHPAGLAAIANLPIARQQALQGGRTRTEFEETPTLSPYLLAFAVGPFEATEPARTRSGIPCRVWLPPGLARQATYARDCHVRALEYLEPYTALPYPYRKVDAIGLPDFAAGAMENPGAITYRVRLLSTDPATTSVGVLRGVFSTVAHELTHMWWGDLATMAWWDDLWLNESFASLIGDETVAALEPEWRVWRDFVASAAHAFSLDALASTHPISGEVRNAQQATERFDAISYEKGAAVLRMIERYLGPDVFRDGVRTYLRRYAERNATADDFWRALDEASGQDVSRIANAWVKAPGHPLLDCVAEPLGDGLRVTLRQRRFFADPSAAPSEQRWPIPAVIRFGTAEGARVQRLLVDGPSASVDLPGARWFYPNADAAGFYRFAFDAASLERLVPALFDLSAEERLLLVDDTWALVRAGAVPLTQLVTLLRALGPERDRAVLGEVATVLGWLDVHAIGDDARPAFGRLVEELFHGPAEELGWEARDGESHDEKLLRRTALGTLGRVARSTRVRVEAVRRIHGYLAGERLDPDVASAAARIAAAGGDASLYDGYVARLREAMRTDPQEEQRFRVALADFEEADLVRRTVEASFGGDLVRRQDMPGMVAALLGSRHGREAAWAAVRERWDTHVVPLEGFLKQGAVGSLAQLTPRRYVGEVVAFLESKRSPDIAEAVARAVERLRIDAATAERMAKELPIALS